MRAAFGDFILDTDSRELLRAGKPVRLAPKAFQLLQILFEARPKAIAQDDLYDRLWPETFVEKASLHNLVYQVREALGDDKQSIVRTVYGFGFAFGGTAQEPPPASAWQIVARGHEFDLTSGENIVGRERGVTVRIASASISRRHARLFVDGGRVTLEDLGSKNGTRVNDRPVQSPTDVHDGDRIVFGTVPAKLRVVRPAATTESVG